MWITQTPGSIPCFTVRAKSYKCVLREQHHCVRKIETEQRFLHFPEIHFIYMRIEVERVRSHLSCCTSLNCIRGLQSSLGLEGGLGASDCGALACWQGEEWLHLLSWRNCGRASWRWKLHAVKQQLHAKKRGECLAHPWINYKEEENSLNMSMSMLNLSEREWWESLVIQQHQSTKFKQ